MHSSANGGSSSEGSGGLSAEEAVTMVKEAPDEAAQAEAIDQVGRRHGKQFDWNYFWNKLREAKVSERFSWSTRRHLYTLHQISCREDWFQNFTALVLESPSSLGEAHFIFGYENRCKAPIGSELSQKLLALLAQGMLYGSTAEEKQIFAKYIAEFFNREVRLGAYSVEGAENLSRALTFTQWSEVLQLLTEAGAGSELVGILRSQSSIRSARLADTFSRGAMQSPAAFDSMVQRLGLRWVLDAFDLSSNENLNTLTKQQKLLLLERMAQAFENFQFNAIEPWDSLAQGYAIFTKIRGFERRMDNELEGTFSVTWLERLQNHLEQFLSIQRDMARSVISGLTRENLDDIWLRLRFLGRADARRTAFDQSPSTRIDRVLAKRLKVHLASSLESRKTAITDFCDELKASGFAEVQVSSLSDLATPGCKTWSGPGSISSGKVSMAADSVLKAPGAWLEISVSSFDGSIIDLSPTQSALPPLPIEETPASFDAVAFPVLIGFKVLSSEIFPEGNGVHHTLVHYVHEPAKTGPVPTTKPARGFSGGELRIAVTDETHSFAPAALSLGGAGQKAAAARRGGKGANYSARLRDYDQWLQKWAENDPELARRGEKPILCRSPNVLDLKRLFNFAEHSREETPNGPVAIIRTFINPGYTELLDETSRAQLTKACTPKAVPDCLTRDLAPKVAEYLRASVNNRNSPDDDNKVIPIVATGYDTQTTFTTPDGDKGPADADGTRGDDGVITFSGFSDDSPF